MGNKKRETKSVKKVIEHNEERDFENMSLLKAVQYISQAMIIIFTLDFANKVLITGDTSKITLMLNYTLTLTPIIVSIVFIIIALFAMKHIDKVSEKRQNLFMFIWGTLGLIILLIIGSFANNVILGEAPFLIIFIALLIVHEVSKSKLKKKEE